MFYVFVGLSKRWAVINCYPALNCTTVSNHDEQVTYEVMSALEIFAVPLAPYSLFCKLVVWFLLWKTCLHEAAKGSWCSGVKSWGLHGGAGERALCLFWFAPSCVWCECFLSGPLYCWPCPPFPRSPLPGAALWATFPPQRVLPPASPLLPLDQNSLSIAVSFFSK